MLYVCVLYVCVVYMYVCVLYFHVGSHWSLTKLCTVCVVHVCCTCYVTGAHMYGMFLCRDQLLKKLSEMGSVVTDSQEAEFKVGKVRAAAAAEDDEINSESEGEEDGEGSPIGKVEESQTAGHRYVNPLVTLCSVHINPSYFLSCKVW